MNRLSLMVCLTLSLWFSQSLLFAQSVDTANGDHLIKEYFRAQVQQLEEDCLSEVKNLDDWNNNKQEYRRQLFEMLGLDPLPPKTDLNPVITKEFELGDVKVQNLHFQSIPGLYVTANLYAPKDQEKPLPAILYVCGHGRMKKNGISYGNKTTYHHHGLWFARNGYVCLTIDTIQLGEIEGLHHGTYGMREGKNWKHMWWWMARGYTPAGVEAWNGIRALDYLQSRKEVDPERLGVTGRSGGGAYSWWVAALDERIKAAVPVAGITDLQNHVVDGCVTGHCDCMYMVNTYRWDYAKVAALVAPRALLISNTDKDPIFPLEGVVRIHATVRKVYNLHNAPNKLGLHITEGPHLDTQELRIHAFRWFNHWLKDDKSLITQAASKEIPPESLKVFPTIPADEVVTKIQESFVPKAKTPSVPTSKEQWTSLRDGWMKNLTTKSFRGWPEKAEPLKLKEAFRVQQDGVDFSAYDFVSQEHVPLRLYVAHRAGLKRDDLDLTVLNVLDQQDWQAWLGMMRTKFEKQLNEEIKTVSNATANPEEFDATKKMFANFKWGMAYLAPRGIGLTGWNSEVRNQVHIRRRFYLIGQTLDGMQVYDTRRGIQALRAIESMSKVPLWLQSERTMSGVALYASLYEPNIARLDLHHPPTSHREGPIFLNVLKTLDMPQAMTMATERSQVRIYQDQKSGWEFPQATQEKLNWDAKQFQVRVLKKE